MSFGLFNAPITFMCLMNHVVRKHIGLSIVIYFDDILMYSYNHMEHLMVVFETLCDAKLYRKLKKCHFYQESVVFLDYIISSSRVKVNKANDKSN
jgi:hypothetical protein